MERKPRGNYENRRNPESTKQIRKEQRVIQIPQQCRLKQCQRNYREGACDYGDQQSQINFSMSNNPLHAPARHKQTRITTNGCDGSKNDSLHQFDRRAANQGIPVGQMRFRGNACSERRLMQRAVTRPARGKTSAPGQKRTVAARLSSLFHRIHEVRTEQFGFLVFRINRQCLLRVSERDLVLLFRAIDVS